MRLNRRAFKLNGGLRAIKRESDCIRPAIELSRNAPGMLPIEGSEIGQAPFPL